MANTGPRNPSRNSRIREAVSALVEDPVGKLDMRMAACLLIDDTCHRVHAQHPVVEVEAFENRGEEQGRAAVLGAELDDQTGLELAQDLLIVPHVANGLEGAHPEPRVVFHTLLP